MIEWARAQMQESGVPDRHQSVIEEMLVLFWDHSEDQGFSEDAVQEFLDVFSELALNHALVEERVDEVWVQSKPGALFVRDTVRVRADAYSSSAGLLHNGRIGVVTAIRYGDVHVRYTDGKNPTPESVRHSPYSLEKQIQ